MFLIAAGPFGGKTLWAYDDADGTLLWDFYHGSFWGVMGSLFVARNASGQILHGGVSHEIGTPGYGIRLHNSLGVQQWAAPTAHLYASMYGAIDINGDVYSGVSGSPTSTIATRKFAADDGTPLWTHYGQSDVFTLEHNLTEKLVIKEDGVYKRLNKADGTVAEVGGAILEDRFATDGDNLFVSVSIYGVVTASDFAGTLVWSTALPVTGQNTQPTPIFTEDSVFASVAASSGGPNLYRLNKLTGAITASASVSNSAAFHMGVSGTSLFLSSQQAGGPTYSYDIETLTQNYSLPGIGVTIYSLSANYGRISRGDWPADEVASTVTQLDYKILQAVIDEGYEVLHSTLLPLAAGTDLSLILKQLTRHSVGE